jgi:hypothetical protein
MHRAEARLCATDIAPVNAGCRIIHFEGRPANRLGDTVTVLPGLQQGAIKDYVYQNVQFRKFAALLDTLSLVRAAIGFARTRGKWKARRFQTVTS